MRFPGKRKSHHYFPVNERGRVPFNQDFSKKGSAYIVGIDQVLVDIEANVSDEFLVEHDLLKGESNICSDQQIEKIYETLKANDAIVGEYAGGAIGNTLHNFSTLANSKSIILGTISKKITVGDYAYKYICNTSSLVDLSYLRPCDGPMGKAICLVTPDGERSFGISEGNMNNLHPRYISSELVKGSAILLLSAFLLRNEDSDIYKATIKAAQIAKDHNIPIVFSMGSSSLVEEKRDFLQKFILDYVSILAMNDDEAVKLSGKKDPLLAGEFCLDLADLVLITVGAQGLYLCSHVDEDLKRETKHQLHSKSLFEYNKYEYSRAMLKKDCLKPLKIYSHINPYMGGPGSIANTNGAGDAALSAVLHDMAANVYHQEMVPGSIKHTKRFLTYSSISQICKYANRVSFEVLKQNSPRLLWGLPDKEDCLEESYWEK